jgi:hypothetical protein
VVGTISLEMSDAVLQQRMRALYEQRFSDIPRAEFVKAIRGRIRIHDADTLKGRGRIDVVKHEKEITDFIRQHGLDFLVIDTLSRVHTVDENDNSEIGQVLDVLGRIGQVTGCTIMVVHHISKMARSAGHHTTGRGGASLRDSHQWAFALEFPEWDKLSEGAIRVLRHDKANMTGYIPDIYLEMREGGILHNIDKADARNLSGQVKASADASDKLALSQWLCVHWDNLGRNPSVTEVIDGKMAKDGPAKSHGFSKDRARDLLGKLAVTGGVIIVPANELAEGTRGGGNRVVQPTPENMERFAAYVNNSAARLNTLEDEPSHPPVSFEKDACY